MTVITRAIVMSYSRYNGDRLSLLCCVMWIIFVTIGVEINLLEKEPNYEKKDEKEFDDRDIRFFNYVHIERFLVTKETSRLAF